MRGRRSSTADVEGLAQEGFRRGGCEGTRAPPRAAPARLELLCQEEICREEVRRKISPNFGLVAAVPGLCWSSSREKMEPGME